ncbi:glycosyltransferase family 2 protein [Corynebacterium propinquum]
MAWNEEAFLPYFLNHYAALGARITVFDNESTDATAEIAASWPDTSGTSFSTADTLRDDVNSYIKSTAWRAPGAPFSDWVI